MRSKVADTLLLGVFVLASAMMISLIVAALLLPPLVDRVVESYTDPAPKPLEIEAAEGDERVGLEERLDTFFDRDVVRASIPVLRLSSRDLNTLIQEQLTDSDYEGAFRLHIEGSNIRCDLSIPLEDSISIGSIRPELAGRYLNGVAEVELYLARGELIISIDEIEIGDRKLPGWIVGEIESEFRKLALDGIEGSQEWIDEVAGLEIVDGAVVLYGPQREIETNESVTESTQPGENLDTDPLR